jgi:chemotaxis protein MotB
MCAERNASAPVIIKRKKIIAGGGHHGGAWKVAYADFVTAMWAFFMLMWLLNATTENQRKGLADYFSPSIPISRVSAGGDGMFGGDSVLSEDRLAHSGKAPPAALSETETVGPDADADAKFMEEVRRIEEELLGRGGESLVSESAARHIVTRVTDEGLVVDLFDLEGEPLFIADTSEPTQVARDLVTLVAGVFALARNGVAVNGHVRSYTSVLRVNPAWDLSVDRAVVTRTLLEEAGISKPRIERVTGFADRKPAHANPMAPGNNRIELILLRASR